MSKKEVKLTMIEKLIVISTFMAATVIIYTACWYVKISEVKEEKHNAAEQLYLCNMNADGDIYNSEFGRIKEDTKDYLNEYRVGEPIKTEMINRDDKMYKICYYSTELKAQTVYQRYLNKYPTSTIDSNIITILCK